MKTYWLSFCDADTGENLGVCLIDVTEEDLDDAVAVFKRANRNVHPTESEAWVHAAIGASLRMKCNPGGSVEAIEVDPTQLPDMPRNRLIPEGELRRNGWA